MSKSAVALLPRGRYISHVSYDEPMSSPMPSVIPDVSQPILPRAMKAKKAAANLVVTLLIIVVGFSGVMQLSGSKEADAFLGLNDLFCFQEAFSFEPTSPDSRGLASFGIGEPIMRKDGVNLPNDGPMTAYEKYGISGAQFAMYKGTEIGMNQIENNEGIDRSAAKNEIKDNENDPRANGPCFAFMGLAETGVANIIFLFTGILTSIAIWVYGAAFNPEWVSDLNDAVASVISGPGGDDGLRDILYFDFINIVLILGALYLGWVGLAKRASLQAGQAAVWMIMAVFAGSLILYSPTFLPSAANTIVGGVEEAILRGTTGVALGISDEESDANFCSIGGAGNYDPSREIPDSQRTKVIRQMECSLWSTFIYMPWVAGQYGMSPSDARELAGDDEFKVTIGDKEISGDIALYQFDAQSMDYTAEISMEARKNKMESWFEVPDYLAKNEPNAFSSWSGTTTSGRIGVASLSLVAAIFGLVSVIALSMSMLVYNLAMVMLIFVSVLFLLIGAHPGMGRGIALRWAELIVGTVLKRIMAAAILGLLMAFYAIIINNSIVPESRGGMSYGIALLAIIAVSVAALGYRKTITEAFSNVTFGGTQSGMEGGPSAGARRVGAALGATALSGTAALASGKAISSGLAAARRPGGNNFTKTLRGVGAAAKTTAKAGVTGGKHGAISGRMSGYAALDAYKSGARKADEEVNEQIKRNKDDWQKISPEDRDREETEHEKAVAKYREDYEKHLVTDEKGNVRLDSGWENAFVKYYGMKPPNPEQSDFYGYGQRRNPRTGKFEKRPSTLLRPRKRKEEQNGDGDDPNPPPTPPSPPPTPAPRPTPGGGATVYSFPQGGRDGYTGGADSRPPSGGSSGGEDSTSPSGEQNGGPEASSSGGATVTPIFGGPSSTGSSPNQSESVSVPTPRQSVRANREKIEFDRRYADHQRAEAEFNKMDMGADGSQKRQQWARKKEELRREEEALAKLKERADANERTQTRPLPKRPKG